MSVSAIVTAGLTVTETLSGSDAVSDTAANNQIKHDKNNLSATWTDSSTPPAAQVASFTVTLSTGAATIDLRALPTEKGGAIDGNGQKVQAVLFKNLGANPMTIADGASNGYNLFGDASGQVTLQPGATMLWTGNDSLPDIDGTHKTIDITGTGSQQLYCRFVLG